MFKSEIGPEGKNWPSKNGAFLGSRSDHAGSYLFRITISSEKNWHHARCNLVGFDFKIYTNKNYAFQPHETKKSVSTHGVNQPLHSLKQ